MLWPCLLDPQWGHVSLVTAMRVLLSEALKDPLNERCANAVFDMVLVPLLPAHSAACKRPWEAREWQQ